MTRAQVGVNLLWLVPGDVGGSESSTTASLRALAALDPADLALRLWVLAPFAAAHPDLAAAFPIEALPSTGRRRVGRVLAEARWLPSRTSQVDLVHHAGGTAPLRSRTPYVLTLHDLQPLEATATHSLLKRLYLAAVVPRSLRGARVVVVPSAFVQRSVVERTGLPADRVTVVHHGVARHRSPTPPAELARRYGLDGPVVLYPAITYPHKNHATLVAAFAEVVVAHPAAHLVLTGRADTAEAAVMAQVERLGLAGRVHRLGRVSDEDVAGLYELAEVVAVPSRYEGFGLPAAEAMASGVAVVAADATALPEVVGDAGVLVDPDDVAGWASAIGDLLADDARRHDLAERGRRRAEAAFSWSANAAGLVDVYRRALAGR